MVKSKVPCKCEGCGMDFESRNALFRHLKETSGSCLDPEALADYQRYVLLQSREKVLLLYGYVILPGISTIANGQDAAMKLIQTMEGYINPDPSQLQHELPKFTRSYGYSGRNVDILKQDDNTGAVTEVLATRLPPVVGSVEDWLTSVNRLLDKKGYTMRVLGRIGHVPSKFHAEMDVSHRRIEYLLPADFLAPGINMDLTDFFASLPSFSDGYSNTKASKDDEHDEQSTSPQHIPPNGKTLTYLFALKKKMQSLTTNPTTKYDNKNNNGECTGGKSRKRYHNFSPKSMAHDFFVYRRMSRMYHRATLRFPDSVYDEVEEKHHQQQQQQQSNPHCGTNFNRDRPFIAMSVSGDMFLHGQACRVMGIFLALARGVISDDFVDCVFDEDYPHLVPTLAVPAFALYAAEANYMTWEGKMKKILTPRKCDIWEGWNNEATLERVNEWQETMRLEVAKAWLSQGVDPEDGRLIAEKKWTNEVLEPWASKAQQQLEDYRRWKLAKSQDTAVGNFPAQLPRLESIDKSVPALYEKVLQCLRDADKSGLWPSTTPKRQMVMVSTLKQSESLDRTSSSVHSSLSKAHMIAKNNKVERSSAYEFKEGEGGASGSFSVGAMPLDLQCGQPKANKLFPDLMKAAFELEIALRPDREPSSTIAVNRNAQFRPHTDSGAGVGQSTSLIVALGNFVGGELVVEGKTEDIRYRAIEFNGWKQRHWTMPFAGERYSLVWFTPKGCEGVRGIDLTVE